MRIWAKAIKDDKIVKDATLEKSGQLKRSLFESALRSICEEMDIPCPLVLLSHFRNFAHFRITKFLPADFVESVNFDSFTIEDITE